MNQADRTTLRRELRARRRALPAPVRIAAAEALAARLLASPFLSADPRAGGHVAGYWAMDGEIGLHALQLRLPPAFTWCLPLLHTDGTLRFAPWKPGDALVTNRHGIPEPEVDPAQALAGADMAVVLVPLVGFDADCHRLGMGGGWYDRTFAFRRRQPAPPSLVGVAFELQRIAAGDAQDWDVPLDAVCTEAELHLPRSPSRSSS